VGDNTRQIACSAKRAGFYVVSASHWDYSDLINCGDVTLVARLYNATISVKGLYIRTESPGVIDVARKGLKALVNGLTYDHAILAPGAEMLDIPRTAGNSPSLARFVNDKERLKDKLQSLGYPVPERFDLEDNLSFPVILKPKQGIAGKGVVIVRDKLHLQESIEQYHENGFDDFLLEEYVRGVDASASVLSTGKQALTVAISEQLLGLKGLGPITRFGWCGSVTPLRTKFAKEIEEIANSVTTDLGLVGTNGIDFVIGANGPVVVEINPRFQASLNTIESALGLNMVDAHIRSCKGELVAPPRPSKFACYLAYNAERDFQVTKTCNHANYMEIPRKGTLIKYAEQVILAIGCGKSRDCAFNNALFYIETAKRYFGVVRSDSAKSEGFKTLDLTGADSQRLSMFKSKFDPVLEPFCYVDKTNALGKIAKFVFTKLGERQILPKRSGRESNGAR
jgi:predicted ATP-grasp superfamily ATP-dependent carboligase